MDFKNIRPGRNDSRAGATAPNAAADPAALSMHDEHSFRQVAAATILQAAWRGRQARGPKNPMGFHEVYGAEGRAGQAMPQAFVKPADIRAGQRAQYLRMPDQPAVPRSGTDWTLTHESAPTRDKRLVALTRNGTALPSGTAMAPDIRQALSGIDHVTMAHQVRPDLKIAERMDEDAFEAVLRGPLPMASFTGALEALKAMHEKSLIHRDIKLENMLMKDGKAHIADLDGVGFSDSLADDGVYTMRHLDAVTYAYTAAVAAEGPSALRDHQSVYGKVNDDLAMIQALILGTHPDPVAMQGNFARILGMTRKIDSLPPETSDSSRQNWRRYLSRYTAKVQPWIDTHVRPEFRSHITLLLTSPVEYQHMHGTGLHLADMMNPAPDPYRPAPD